MSEDVRVAVLEQKLEDLKHIVIKIDDAIEKLSEVNINVGKMLAVHEQKISDQEKTDAILYDKINQLSDKVNVHYDNLLYRIQAIERKVWIALGVISTVSFIISNFEFMSNLTRPDSRVTIEENRIR